jgi:hypothetical protein
MQSPPFQIYDDFNELEFLFDSNWNDVFGEITKKRFGANLLFAIIETVTISEVSSVGTTQYISYQSIDIIQDKIHKEYMDVIEVIKGTEFGSPSQYYDWYKREKYYYALGENKNAEPIYSPLLNSKIIDPELKPESNKYIKEYDRKLSDYELKKFFTDYTNCLLSKDWFKELPHYFILVKPISIRDKETNLFIPLGNLYLKIGTNIKVEIKEYMKYVNHLKSAWFNKFGDKILKEYSEKKTSDEYKPKLLNSSTLRNKLAKPLFKNGGKEISLNDLFYYTFDLDANSQLLDKRIYLFYSDHSFIKKMIGMHSDKEAIKTLIKNTYDSKDDPLNVLNKTVLALKGVDENSIKYFLLLLSKRRLALALLLIFGFTLEETHETIAFGERTTKTTSTTKDHADYLVNNLFITGSNNLKDAVHHLADREILFLKNLLHEIRKLKSDFPSKWLK